MNTNKHAHTDTNSTSRPWVLSLLHPMKNWGSRSVSERANNLT